MRLWLECPGVRPNAEGESISPPHLACLLVKDRQASAQNNARRPPHKDQQYLTKLVVQVLGNLWMCKGVWGSVDV